MQRAGSRHPKGHQLTSLHQQHHQHMSVPALQASLSAHAGGCSSVQQVHISCSAALCMEHSGRTARGWCDSVVCCLGLTPNHAGEGTSTAAGVLPACSIMCWCNLAVWFAHMALTCARGCTRSIDDSWPYQELPACHSECLGKALHGDALHALPAPAGGIRFVCIHANWRCICQGACVRMACRTSDEVRACVTVTAAASPGALHAGVAGARAKMQHA